jgi:peptide/nickel transport system permease protein
MPRTLRRLLANPLGFAGFATLLVILIVVAFGSQLAPYDPEAFHAARRLEGPSADFWLGTDQFGRDLLSRLLTGAASSVLFGLGATVLAAVMGGLIGIVSGYSGGVADSLIMRATDVLLSIPGLLLTLLIVNLLGPGMANGLLAVAAVFTPGFARLARASTLAVRELDYVRAARARGETHVYMLGREILPNVVAPILVEGSIRIAMAIMIGATLSFLGLGAQAPESDWGLMVAEARSYMFRSPWLLLWPALGIGIASLGFNMLGDGLRDALNPRAAGRAR